MRADKFLFHHQKLGRRPAFLAIAKGHLVVNGVVVQCASEVIQKFDRVDFLGETLQNVKPRYIMLHKPAGYVSATIDLENQTVIDLLPEVDEELHLAGRLDKSTTGMVLLTNNGMWSRAVTSPDSKVPKVYDVKAELSICPKMLEDFQCGIFFEKEGVKTQPAEIRIINDFEIQLTIFEGMHHQIKRMFLKYGNRVVYLHRRRIGEVELNISVGKWRDLTNKEMQSLSAL